MSTGATVAAVRRHLGALSRATLAALAAVWLASCSSRERPPLPPSAAVIAADMSEFSFDVVAEARAGRTVFRARNLGQQAHDLYLLPVPDDAPPAKESFGPSGVRQPRAPVALLKPLAPGERASFAYDLVPGRYTLVCLLKTPDGQSHAVLGMAGDLRVRPRDGATPNPSTTPNSSTTSTPIGTRGSTPR